MKRDQGGSRLTTSAITPLAIAAILGLVMLVAVGCGGDDKTAEPTTPVATATAEPTTPVATTTAEPTTPVTTATAEPTTPVATATAEPTTPTSTETAEPTPAEEAITLAAPNAAPTIDGDNADWADIEGATFEIAQIEIPEGADIEIDPVDPKNATLKVASDGTNVYVLVEVDDTFDYTADDHALSPSMAVMFRIDEAAPPHMGTTDTDLETSLGMVDIWHWELDCGPGEVSGGKGVAGGDDATCNLDDEYATTPEDREDDGGGDTPNPDAENGLTGAWTHTASAPGEDGTWIFEMSRPLDTGDPQDAQLATGGTAYMAIAYWDPKESTAGWSDAGHLQSAEHGWIEVTLPEGDAVTAITLAAPNAAPTIDGDNADWADIEGATFEIAQIEIPEGADIEIDPVDPKNATLKVASDGTNIYVLLEVDDTFDYNADDHALSPALGVMFRIDEAAPAHMGTTAEDLETSLGMVDIWHWELDCGPGEVSGGKGVAGGDDPTCNLDDEYATTPEDREDDGGGDTPNPDAENGLTGAWTHTASAPGEDGTWIFEMSRPLDTGDPQDAQFASGGTAYVAIAYWDPKESTTGWSDAGHLQSADLGWIEVTLP